MDELMMHVILFRCLHLSTIFNRGFATNTTQWKSETHSHRLCSLEASRPKNPMLKSTPYRDHPLERRAGVATVTAVERVLVSLGAVHHFLFTQVHQGAVSAQRIGALYSFRYSKGPAININVTDNRITKALQ